MLDIEFRRCDPILATLGWAGRVYEGETATEAAIKTVGSATGYTDVKEGAQIIGGAESWEDYVEGGGRILEGTGKVAGWLLAGHTAYKSTHQPLRTPTPDPAPPAPSAPGIIEQYSLRASESGFYPVMKRGFRSPKSVAWLEKGEPWKYGTTKNPRKRYSGKFLRTTERGLQYQTEWVGTLAEALRLENMKILNHVERFGDLPAGNKIVR